MGCIRMFIVNSEIKYIQYFRIKLGIHSSHVKTKIAGVIFMCVFEPGWRVNKWKQYIIYLRSRDAAVQQFHGPDQTAIDLSETVRTGPDWTIKILDGPDRYVPVK